MRFRTPEIFLGAFLAVAIFAMGMLFASSLVPQPERHHEQQAAGTVSTKESEKQGFWEKTADDPVAYFTVWLVGFTGVLAVSTIGLWIVTWRSGRKQSRDMKASIDLARQEFISTHRPKIVVWSLDFGGDANGEEPIPATFRYVNSGDSPALITGFGSRFMRLSEPTIPAGLEFSHQEIDPPYEVESGMHGFRLTPNTISPDEIVASGIMNIDKIVCVGYVLYRDRNGTRRQVGFCREFNSETGRWVVLSDDEYEYSY